METSVNNKCRAFTSLEQSKKLAEILPLESADMSWVSNGLGKPFARTIPIKGDPEELCACWSLAALLNILDYPQLPRLSKDKLGSGKVGWMVSAYPNDCRYDSCWHDEPIDACYELILKLNELKMDYKEKLKLAKEALDSGSYDKETIEYIFPELAESEDERIRKELIEFVKSRGGFKQEYIAWLEKQAKDSPILSNSTKNS